MVKFLSQRAKWIIALFGFFVFGLSQTTWLITSDLWQKTEGALIDRRYSLRGETARDQDIVLVGIGTSAFKLDTLAPEEIAASPTLQLMQQPWPWDRRVYAAVLEKMMDAGARVVMFDFVFASETEGDDEFAKALQKYKDHVVVGEMIQDEKGAESKTKRLITPNDRLLLPATGPVVGLVNLQSDADEVVRRGVYHTSIERESGLGGFQDNLIHITVMAVKKFNGKTILPPNDPPNYVDYQGQSGTYRPLPVENVFVEKLWQAPPFNGGLTFSNKIVVVGPMAEIFHDSHITPFGDMPGPEIQAQIIAALLRESWLMATSPLTDFAIALLMMWLGLEICLRIGNALLKTATLVIAVIVFFAASQIAFAHFKLVLPMAQPLFCLAVPGAFGIVFQYALEQFERRRYRNILGRYVSENVAKAVLEDKRSFEESLRGAKKPVTILFSDIRGFTSMTETADADKLVAQLNEYFLEMVGVVLKEQGTLQKFIGDAIMAAWGDTHSEGLEKDARRAVNAALQMRGALAKLNERWKDESDRPKLAIGIGVNHGDVVVGNIGHPQRMEFTVLGDGVNLAARLESATKQFHTDVLIGEETEKLTRGQFVYRFVGAVAFKGKLKPVKVFTLLSDHSAPPPKWLAKYDEAVRLYQERQFERAVDCFAATAEEIGGQDYLCKMYIDFCVAHAQKPPPVNWDGSFALTEK